MSEKTQVTSSTALAVPHGPASLPAERVASPSRDRRRCLGFVRYYCSRARWRRQPQTHTTQHRFGNAITLTNNDRCFKNKLRGFSRLCEGYTARLWRLVRAFAVSLVDEEAIADITNTSTTTSAPMIASSLHTPTSPPKRQDRFYTPHSSASSSWTRRHINTRRKRGQLGVAGGGHTTSVRTNNKSNRFVTAIAAEDAFEPDEELELLSRSCDAEADSTQPQYRQDQRRAREEREAIDSDDLDDDGYFDYADEAEDEDATQTVDTLLLDVGCVGACPSFVRRAAHPPSMRLSRGPLANRKTALAFPRSASYQTPNARANSPSHSLSGSASSRIATGPAVPQPSAQELGPLTRYSSVRRLAQVPNSRQNQRNDECAPTLTITSQPASARPLSTSSGTPELSPFAPSSPVRPVPSPLPAASASASSAVLVRSTNESTGSSLRASGDGAIVPSPQASANRRFSAMVPTSLTVMTVDAHESRASALYDQTFHAAQHGLKYLTGTAPSPATVSALRWWWRSPRRILALVLCVALIILCTVVATVAMFNCTYFLRGRLCHRPGQHARYYTTTSTCAAALEGRSQTEAVALQHTLPLETLRTSMSGVYEDLHVLMRWAHDKDARRFADAVGVEGLTGRHVAPNEEANPTLSLSQNTTRTTTSSGVPPVRTRCEAKAHLACAFGTLADRARRASQPHVSGDQKGSSEATPERHTREDKTQGSGRGVAGDEHTRTRPTSPLPQSRRQVLGLEVRVAALLEARQRAWKQTSSSQMPPANDVPTNHPNQTTDSSSTHTSAPAADARRGPQPPRIRFATYTNTISPTGCALVASAALTGFHYTLLGYQQPYGHIARHLAHIEWIVREGLADDDIVVFTDSDAAWTGADVAPFLAKFADLSPASEAALDVVKVRAWEDYGEALAPVVLAGMRRSALLDDEVAAHTGQRQDRAARVAAESEATETGRRVNGMAAEHAEEEERLRERWRRLVQMPPVLFNAESSCQRSHAVTSESQCQSEADLLELMIATRRNRPASMEKALLAYLQPWTRGGEEDQSVEMREISRAFLAQARAVVRRSFSGPATSSLAANRAPTGEDTDDNEERAPSGQAVHAFAHTVSAAVDIVRRSVAERAVSRKESRDERLCVPPRRRYWGVEQEAPRTSHARPNSTREHGLSYTDTESRAYSVFHYLDGASRIDPERTSLAGRNAVYCAPPSVDAPQGDGTEQIRRRLADPAATLNETATTGETNIQMTSSPSSSSLSPRSVPLSPGASANASDDARRADSARPDQSKRVQTADDSGEVTEDAAHRTGPTREVAHQSTNTTHPQHHSNTTSTHPLTAPPIDSPFEWLSDVLARDPDVDGSPMLQTDRPPTPSSPARNAVKNPSTSPRPRGPSTSGGTAQSSSSSSAPSRETQPDDHDLREDDTGSEKHYQPHRHAARRPTDVDYYFPNFRGTLNSARHLNAGGVVARVWAYKALVRAMLTYIEEHFPLDVSEENGDLVRWLRMHGGMPLPLSDAARRALFDPQHDAPHARDIASGQKKGGAVGNSTLGEVDSHKGDAPTRSTRSCRAHAQERGWHNDQAIIASMYVYGRIWEVEEDLLTAPLAAATPTSMTEKTETGNVPRRRRLDPFGLPPGLIGLDRENEFFFVTPFMEPGRHYVTRASLEEANTCDARTDVGVAQGKAAAAVSVATTSLFPSTSYASRQCNAASVLASSSSSPSVLRHLFSLLRALRRHIEHFMTAPLARLWEVDAASQREGLFRNVAETSGASSAAVRRAIESSYAAMTATTTTTHTTTHGALAWDVETALSDDYIRDLVCPLYLLAEIAAQPSPGSANTTNAQTRELTSNAQQTPLPDTGFPYIYRPLFAFRAPQHNYAHDDTCTVCVPATLGTTSRASVADCCREDAEARTDKSPRAPLPQQKGTKHSEPQGAAQTSTDTLHPGAGDDAKQTRAETWTAVVTPPLFGRRVNVQDVLRSPSSTHAVASGTLARARHLSELYARTMQALGVTPALTHPMSHLFPREPHHQEQAYLAQFRRRLTSSANTSAFDVFPDEEAHARALFSRENRCLLNLVGDRWQATRSNTTVPPCRACGAAAKTSRLPSSPALSSPHPKATAPSATQDNSNTTRDRPRDGNEDRARGVGTHSHSTTNDDLAASFEAALSHCLSSLRSASISPMDTAVPSPSASTDSATAHVEVQVTSDADDADATELDALTQNEQWRRHLQTHCVFPASPLRFARDAGESALLSSASLDPSSPFTASLIALDHSTREEAEGEEAARDWFWRAHHVDIARFPRMMHFAGDWKDLRFREHRHGLTWFVPGQYDRDARAHNEAALKALEVEWISVDSAHYFSYEGLCGLPYGLV